MIHKIKNKRYPKTVTESNLIFVERDKIDTHKTQIHMLFYIPSLVEPLQ